MDSNVIEGERFSKPKPRYATQQAVPCICNVCDNPPPFYEKENGVSKACIQFFHFNLLKATMNEYTGQFEENHPVFKVITASFLMVAIKPVRTGK